MYKGVKTVTTPTQMADVIHIYTHTNTHTIMCANIFECELVTMKLNKWQLCNELVSVRTAYFTTISFITQTLEH